MSEFQLPEFTHQVPEWHMGYGGKTAIDGTVSEEHRPVIYNMEKQPKQFAG